MKTRLVALVAGLALGTSLLFTTAGIVTATTPPAGPAGTGVCLTQATALKASVTVDTLRAFGDCEINRRLATLTSLSSKITASKVMTSSDAEVLQSEIGSTRSGLTTLKATIDSETNITALRADIVKIATQFRVYLLVVPQVNLVNAADAVVYAQTRFATVNTNLAARIAAAKAAGKDTTAAQADLDAMNASVTAAVGLAGPLPAQLLPLTPAQYNAGTAGPVLKSARTALGTARNDLKSAVADAQACRAALIALK
ncbi:MAG: hypothetical protein ABSE58_05615 [Candidatus Limnocylindrales bacterium]|jgi:hypothetical protein